MNTTWVEMQLAFYEDLSSPSILLASIGMLVYFFGTITRPFPSTDFHHRLAYLQRVPSIMIV